MYQVNSGFQCVTSEVTNSLISKKVHRMGHALGNLEKVMKTSEIKDLFALEPFSSSLIHKFFKSMSKSGPIKKREVLEFVSPKVSIVTKSCR